MIVRSKIPTWFGAKAMALWPVILVSPNARMSEIDINHERIHLAQYRDLFVIGFYLWYGIEWCIKSLLMWKGAYRELSLEREAYANEKDMDYLKTRKRFGFMKYLTILLFMGLISSCQMHYHASVPNCDCSRVVHKTDTVHGFTPGMSVDGRIPCPGIWIDGKFYSITQTQAVQEVGSPIVISNFPSGDGIMELGKSSLVLRLDSISKHFTTK
ncbi:MAG TPA: hypothetical protein PKA53_08470 [Sphingobacterium sp.]|nr:hypothetical protein [Sphingobacterium sp.]